MDRRRCEFPKAPNPVLSSSSAVSAYRRSTAGRAEIYIVHVDVQVPRKLTREQRKLFEELRETLPANNAPHERSVFEKVRDFFG